MFVRRRRVLNLAWNGFGPEGGVAIADALLVNEALVDVDLTGNRLDGKAAQSLGRVFTSKNETLQVLKVRLLIHPELWRQVLKLGFTCSLYRYY